MKCKLDRPHDLYTGQENTFDRSTGGRSKLGQSGVQLGCIVGGMRGGRHGVRETGSQRVREQAGKKGGREFIQLVMPLLKY